MGRLAANILILATLGVLLPASRGLAQTAAPGGAAAPAAREPASAPALPAMPDAPASLFLQPSSAEPYSCEELPGPYFERDPRLDPPTLPPPGWYTAVEIGIVGPHVKNRLTDTVVVGDRAPDVVHLPDAELDWTAAPRFEIGYRLSSGFGEIALAYRFLVSQGSSQLLGADGPATIKSRLDLNIVDLDYGSREFFTEQCPYCGMKWRFGIRYADVFFDSQMVEPFSEAAVGSGIVASGAGNNFWGIGPHVGLELTRQFEQTGFALVGSVDGATLLGRIRQNFFEAFTSPGAAGAGQTGHTRESGSQSVPIINTFVGVRWQPPRYPPIHFDAGYTYEYWWNAGRNSGTNSRGELSDQGVLLRAELNF
jgi:hypothetical protein